MLFKTLSASVYGIDADLVQVEVDVGVGGMEDFCVVGLPDNAVKESRQPSEVGVEELRELHAADDSAVCFAGRCWTGLTFTLKCRG